MNFFRFTVTISHYIEINKKEFFGRHDQNNTLIILELSYMNLRHIREIKK